MIPRRQVQVLNDRLRVIGRGVAAVRRMRERFRRREKTTEVLIQDLEPAGLTQTTDTLRRHMAFLRAERGAPRVPFRTQDLQAGSTTPTPVDPIRSKTA